MILLTMHDQSDLTEMNIYCVKQYSNSLQYDI
jgi:hypothetical protein